jgi:hypothetical protein
MHNSLCAVTPPLMATDDARQAAEATKFRQKLNAMVTADVKKKYATARTQVLAATALQCHHWQMDLQA